MRACILIHLAVSALICCNAQAQVWAPPASEWTYDWWTLTQTGYVSMAVAGDTLITGMPAQKLVVQRHIFDYPSNSSIEDNQGPYYTAVSGSLVSIWDGAAFDTLYWFGAAPGSHWSVPLLDTPQETIVVDTGTTSMDGVPLKYLTVAYGAGNPAADTIFERFGSRQVFIDASYTVLQIDGPILGLRCYHDDLLDYSTGIAEECDFITGIGETPSSAPTRAWPSPFTDRLTVYGQGSGTAELFDVSGRSVLGPLLMQGAPLTLNVGELTPGMYALRIQNGVNTHSIRVIKE